jgi:hypothetical protein
VRRLRQLAVPSWRCQWLRVRCGLPRRLLLRLLRRHCVLRKLLSLLGLLFPFFPRLLADGRRPRRPQN